MAKKKKKIENNHRINMTFKRKLYQWRNNSKTDTVRSGKLVMRNSSATKCFTIHRFPHIAQIFVITKHYTQFRMNEDLVLK